MVDANDRLPPPGDEKALFVLDVMGHVFRAFHALPPLTTSKGEPTHAVLGVIKMIHKLVRERRPTHLAVAVESKTKTFRDEIFPAYKAKRPPPPEGLKSQLPLVWEIVQAYAIPILGHEGYEADDVIASLVRRATAAGLRVVIVTSDKDMMQLVDDDRVVLYDTFKEVVFGPQEVLAKWGVGPDRVRDLLALTGDSIDNVPGVPGVGPKTAVKLLDTYGTLEDVMAHAEEVKQPKLREALIAFREQAPVSKKLVTLVDDLEVAMDLEALRYGGWDEEKLRALLYRLEFRAMLIEVGGAGMEAGATAATTAPAPAPAAAPVPGAMVPTTIEVVVDVARLKEIAAEAVKGGPLAIRSAAIGHRLHGLALAWRIGHAAYVPLRHRGLGVGPQIPIEEATDALRGVLEDPAIAKVGHELKRDDVLFRRLGIRMRGVTFDSMIASYLVDPERHQHRIDQAAGDYLGRTLPPPDTSKDADERMPETVAPILAEEVRAAWDLSSRMRAELDAAGARSLFDDVEMPLSRVLADVEEAGIRIDVPHLERLSRETATKLSEIEKEAHAFAGHAFNLGSPKQLQEVLFKELGLPSARKTKTGYSTDSDVLEGLAAMHPLPAKILEHRLLAKLKGTYLDALPRAVDPETGRVHTVYSQAVAATGRLSSNDPNLQNIPVRTELGLEIRRAFRAGEGAVMLAADYSQIELRVLAHLSGDPVLSEAFRSGEDVHDRTAREVFGALPGQVTKEQRRRAKAINFGVIYGQTEHGLAQSLGIARGEARTFIQAYFARYSRLAAYLDQVVAAAKAGSGVRTILGRRRIIRELQSTNRMIRANGERIARNTPIQGSAADIMKLAMIRVSKRLAAERLATRMVLTVHDELVFEVPENEVEAVGRLAKEEMEKAYVLDVPLVVDVGSGPTWADAH